MMELLRGQSKHPSLQSFLTDILQARPPALTHWGQLPQPRVKTTLLSGQLLATQLSLGSRTVGCILTIHNSSDRSQLDLNRKGALCPKCHHSLVPASLPSSGCSLPMRLDGDNGSPLGRGPRCGKRGKRSSDVSRWPWFLEHQLPLPHMGQMRNWGPERGSTQLQVTQQYS